MLVIGGAAGGGRGGAERGGKGDVLGGGLGRGEGGWGMEGGGGAMDRSIGVQSWRGENVGWLLDRPGFPRAFPKGLVPDGPTALHHWKYSLDAILPLRNQLVAQARLALASCQVFPRLHRLGRWTQRLLNNPSSSFGWSKHWQIAASPRLEWGAKSIA